MNCNDGLGMGKKRNKRFTALDRKQSVPYIKVKYQLLRWFPCYDLPNGF